MPKPKPDQVIRHEFVLGRSEREMLREATTAYQVNRIATPMVSLMNDVSGMTVFLSAIAAVGTLVGLGVSFVFLVSDELSIAGVIDAFVTQTNQHRLAIGLAALGTGGGLWEESWYFRLWRTLWGLELPEDHPDHPMFNQTSSSNSDANAVLSSAANAGYSTVVGNNMAWAQGWSNSGGQVPFP